MEHTTNNERANESIGRSMDRYEARRQPTTNTTSSQLFTGSIENAVRWVNGNHFAHLLTRVGGWVVGWDGALFFLCLSEVGIIRRGDTNIDFVALFATRCSLMEELSDPRWGKCDIDISSWRTCTHDHWTTNDNWSTKIAVTLINWQYHTTPPPHPRRCPPPHLSRLVSNS